MKKVNSVKKLLFIFLILIVASCGKGGDSHSSSSSPSALCNDGTYSYSKNCSGTCSHHKGVNTWYNSCGSKVSVLAPKKYFDVNPEYLGSWEGNWISDKYDHHGVIHINISDDSLIEGILFNINNSISSKLHGSVDENGIFTIFIDITLYPDSNIEYQGDALFKISDKQLIGIINIQEIDDVERIEFVLSKE